MSGTNGKTTTTTLIATAAAALTTVASNSTGANLAAGVFGAIVDDPHAELAVLEVDELLLGDMIDRFDPEVIVLLNLSRDQLDRSHEVMQTARSWEPHLRRFRGVIVANADDPLIVWAVRDAADVVWVAGGRHWIADASACLDCGAQLIVDEAGSWGCGGCGRSRPATTAMTVPPTGLPGRCNEANASMACAALHELGLEQGAAEWLHVTGVAGRYEQRTIEGRDVRVLLAKNPAGWLETFDVLDSDSDLVFSLNAHAVDGLDPSWIWDVPFERLAPRPVVCAGERAVDLAVRLRHAGLDVRLVSDLRVGIGSCTRKVDLVANYSAFRDVLDRMVPACATAQS